MEKTGGENGDDETAASWTYKVTDALSDEKLEENVDPTASPHQWKRPHIGVLTAATFGYAHYDNDNKIVLGWINEKIREARKSYQRNRIIPRWEILAQEIVEIKNVH